MIKLLFALGCVCFGGGVLGLNFITSAAMVRDIYLDGTYMPVMEVITRTAAYPFFALDVILILLGIIIMIVVIVLTIVRKK